MRIAVFLILVLAAGVPLSAGTITLDFAVDMHWRRDLANNVNDPTFQPFTMSVQAVVDDQHLGSLPISSALTRIFFSGVTIASPLSGMVDMGYDLSTLTARDTFAILQSDTGRVMTSISLSERYSGNGVVLNRYLMHTDPAPLSDAEGFDSADLRFLLASHVGSQYGHYEDLVFPGGGGFQHYGTATLTNVAFDTAPVPEPSTGLLLLLPAAVLARKLRRNPAA